MRPWHQVTEELWTLPQEASVTRAVEVMPGPLRYLFVEIQEACSHHALQICTHYMPILTFAPSPSPHRSIRLFPQTLASFFLSYKHSRLTKTLKSGRIMGTVTAQRPSNNTMVPLSSAIAVMA